MSVSCRKNWPPVMGRFTFLGSRQLSFTAFEALQGSLTELEKAILLDYLKLPVSYELRRRMHQTCFGELVEAREAALNKLRQFFQV